MLKSQSPLLQNVTLFGDWVFTNVIRLKEVIRVDLNSTWLVFLKQGEICT